MGLGEGGGDVLAVRAGRTTRLAEATVRQAKAAVEGKR